MEMNKALDVKAERPSWVAAWNVRFVTCMRD
jgi:hypothetical protein